MKKQLYRHHATKRMKPKFMRLHQITNEDIFDWQSFHAAVARFPHQRWLKKFLTDTLPSGYVRAHYGRIPHGHCLLCAENESRNTFQHRFLCTSDTMVAWRKQLVTDLLPDLKKHSDRPLLWDALFGISMPETCKDSPLLHQQRQTAPTTTTRRKAYGSMDGNLCTVITATKPTKLLLEIGFQGPFLPFGSICIKPGKESLRKCILRILRRIHFNKAYTIKQEPCINSASESLLNTEQYIFPMASTTGRSTLRRSPSATGSNHTANPSTNRLPIMRNALPAITAYFQPLR